MKKTIIYKCAIIGALALSGCSFKSSPINLGAPQMAYNGAISQGAQINLQSVTNANPMGSVVVVVKNSEGVIINQIPTSQNLSGWFEKAIKDQFSMAGLNLSSNAPSSVAIKLTKVELIYINDSFNTKNLNVKVTAEMKLTNSKGSVTREYNLEDNKYSATINSSDDLTPYIKDLLTKLTSSMTRDAVNFAGMN